MVLLKDFFKEDKKQKSKKTSIKGVVICLQFLTLVGSVAAQQAGNFNGMDMNIGNLYRLSNAESRSISPDFSLDTFLPSHTLLQIECLELK